jgi:hypothetical protein
VRGGEGEAVHEKRGWERIITRHLITHTATYTHNLLETEVEQSTATKKKTRLIQKRIAVRGSTPKRMSPCNSYALEHTHGWKWLNPNFSKPQFS